MSDQGPTQSIGSLRELNLARRYRSSDDPLNSFYIPCLSRATTYDRAAGYFDSRSLSLGAHGVANLIKNGGEMRLLTSPRFTEDDLKALRNTRSTEETSDIVESSLHRGLDAEEFIEYLEHDRFKCLAWMVDEGFLEIRVAFMPEDSTGNPYRLYHEKIGVLTDAVGNEVAFTGSINETAAGWTENYESFDVYCSWRGEQQRVSDKQADFERLWNNEDSHVVVRELPDTVEDSITKQSPETIDGMPAMELFFTEEGNLQSQDNGTDVELWDHQNKAIDWWKQHNYRGLFAMATGTGKTFTALRAARLEIDTRLTIIIVPTQILIDQWKDEIIDVFGEGTTVLECSGGTGWRNRILPTVDTFREGSLEEVLKLPRSVLLTTPHTASSDAFQRAIRHVDPIRLQLIVDEVHNCGASTFQRVFNIDAGRRIGLSATPNRKWDEEGTQVIYDYFGGQDPFRFETKEAIENGYLSSYEYHPLICELSPGEYDDFRELTTEIQQLSAAMQNNDDTNIAQKRERLLQERARVKKSAKMKPDRFGEFLDSSHPKPAIIFCEDTEQLDEIRQELTERDCRFGTYISSRKDEQGVAFHKFRTGAIDYLLAIRCLDEGVDVPDCPTAVLIASSTNERQFVQRRGRVLRSSAQKDKAVIYDMFVLPGVQAAQEDEAARALVEQELARAKHLMEASMNKDKTEQRLAKELDSYGKRFSDLAYI